MKNFVLYLESGPRMKTTMAHVLEMTGCIAKGKTTAEALDRAPEAIRAFLRFLRRHGADVNPDEAFATDVAEHVTEGRWELGQGSSAICFGPDLNPLSRGVVEDLLQRLGWMQSEILDLVSRLSPAELERKPAAGARSIREILQHAAEAERYYLRGSLGKIDGVYRACAKLRKGQGDPRALFAEARAAAAERIRSATSEERTRVTGSGPEAWTLRKTMRRMLEHQWEHLMEISYRMGKPVYEDFPKAFW